jgi:hypothetical protein
MKIFNNLNDFLQEPSENMDEALGFLDVKKKGMPTKKKLSQTYDSLSEFMDEPTKKLDDSLGFLNIRVKG